MDYKKRNYLICFIIFIGLFTFVDIFILIFNMRGEDLYITPGVGRYEWFFAINVAIIAVLGAGIVSLYLGMPIFSKIYLKSLGKKQLAGFVPEEELSTKSHFIRLWGRSLVLGFFVANIAYTLSSNEGFVQFMLTPLGYQNMINEYGKILVPDAFTMLHIIWIVAIPLTFLFIPIWFLIDVGFVSTKKVKGLDFKSVNVTTHRFYRIIKGYAGIGFTYNLIMIIYSRVVIQANPDPLSTFVQFLIPLNLIVSVFPLAIIMDHQKQRFKKKFESIVIKLDMNKELKCTIDLTDRR